MKKVNIYTHYDDTKTVIAHVIPNEKHEISERRYKELLKQRTVGGNAGIYSDAGYDIEVVDKYGNWVTSIR